MFGAKYGTLERRQSVYPQPLPFVCDLRRQAGHEQEQQG